MKSVTFFYREPRKTGVSIEGIFSLVKECLRDRVEIKEFFCESGISRYQNMLRAARSEDEINHITGDVNFLALGLRRKKVILTIHDMGHYDTLRNRNKLHFMIYRLFWFQLPLRYVDVVTVVSKFTYNKFTEYFNYPKAQIRLICDPVKPIFQFSEKERMSPTPHILMMGTGTHKNLNNLIEAAKGKNVHLDIIGWPSDAELEKIKNYGIAHTLYNRLTDEEVYERYKACDIMFMASFYEGFGMPIIEAQSVGRPVITSDRGAMKEVAGDTALLVDPAKPEEIGSAIDKLITDQGLYRELVRKGLRNIVPYQYELIARQYADLYEELSQ